MDAGAHEIFFNKSKKMEMKISCPSLTFPSCSGAWCPGREYWKLCEKGGTVPPEQGTLVFASSEVFCGSKTAMKLCLGLYFWNVCLITLFRSVVKYTERNIYRPRHC